MIKSLQPIEVIQKLEQEWLNEFQTPTYLLTDQATTFLSQKFKEFLENRKIKHIINTPFNPKCNGISERINKEINVLMRTYKGNKISKIISVIETKLNASIHSSTGYAPEEILYNTNHLEPFKRELNINREEILTKLKKQSEQNKRKRKFKELHYEYKPGDVVLLKNQKRTKSSSIYHNPCIV